MDPEEAIERATDPVLTESVDVGVVGLPRSGATSLLAAGVRVARALETHWGFGVLLGAPVPALEAFAARRLGGDEEDDEDAARASVCVELRRPSRGLFDRGGRWSLRLGPPRPGTTPRGLVVCLDAGDRRAAQRVEALVPLLEARAGRANRVLFVLTKVDRLVGWAGGATCPERLALALDPLNQVDALLGRHGLRSLLEPVPAGTRVGLSLASAWGFCATSGRPVGTGLDAYTRWRPHAVAEALIWLATGIERGAVRELLDGERSAIAAERPGATGPVP